jgi:hypothetical protein
VLAGADDLRPIAVVRQGPADSVSELLERVRGGGGGGWAPYPLGKDDG